jgi:hypothetical protein
MSKVFNMPTRRLALQSLFGDSLMISHVSARYLGSREI